MFPHLNFTRSNGPLLDESEIIRKQEMLYHLNLISTGAKIYMGAMVSSDFINPLDYCYSVLGVKLDFLGPSDPLYKTILLYINNTAEKLKYNVQKIFSLERKGEAERISQWQSLSNHYLLWYGTNTYNILGLLKQGLNTTTTDSIIPSYTFGKGIRFSDMFSRALKNCRTTKNAFIILAEVALGNISAISNPSMLYRSSPTDHSVKVTGKVESNFENSLILSGVHIPVGKPIYPEENLTDYSEYIVYDPSRVRMKYLKQYHILFCISLDAFKCREDQPELFVKLRT